MRKGTLVLVLFAVLIPGCANHDWMINQPAVQSTVQKDPNKAEPGKVIAPPGLGVDLP
jgi:hypothetical protein